ncbi:hypothetical protein A3L08_00750 [Thermococcus pacificus]|uniref:Uncharacterized protein n=2 Tax=Thermococcus pacificus TaxID=71998 RepID=A0A218P590_9EURY|nr:hypothetical protein A3L08_00750 [Thermococcus pacificus]
MARSPVGGVLKLTALLLVLFIVVGNVALRMIPGVKPDGGIKGVLTAPIKVIEYRREHGDNVSVEFGWHSFGGDDERERPPYVRFDGEALWEDVHSPEVRAYVGEIINESIERIQTSGYEVTPQLVRGTAYSLLLQKVHYVHDGRVDLPSYTIEHGGVCSDWALVDYALILAVNERFNVTAEYFFVSSLPPVGVGHAFLAVHYPQAGRWELYDWFATQYLESPYESSRFKVIEIGKNEYLFGWFPAGVAIANQFSSIEEALSVYAMKGGHLQNHYSVTLYRLPEFVRVPQYSTSSFEINTELAMKKIEKIRLRYANYEKQYTLRFEPIGNGGARLLNATVKGDFLRVTFEPLNLSSTVELVAADNSWVVLYDTGGATLAGWKRVTHIGNFPAYKYALLKGKPERLTLLVSLKSDYYEIYPWQVTVRSYMGGNGVRIVLYGGG